MAQNRWGALVSWVGVVLAVWAPSAANARPFRVAQVPNGSVFDCQTCHVGTGGPRNLFGQTVQGSFLDSEGNVLWGPALANIDSDADGRTNGQELLDPAGTWSEGQPDPGIPSQVRRPGVADPLPPVPAAGWFAALLLAGALLIRGGRVARRRRTDIAP